MVPPPGLGLGTRVHAVPFQCTIRVLEPPVSPTAHALRADVAATPMSCAPPPRLGLGTRVHAVPSQCTIRVLRVVKPTAHALRAEVTATPSSAPRRSEAGLGTTFHPVPFQRAISVLLARAGLVRPTAQAFCADVAATSIRTPRAVKDPAGAAWAVRAAAADPGIHATVGAVSSGAATIRTRRAASCMRMLVTFLPEDL